MYIQQLFGLGARYGVHRTVSVQFPRGLASATTPSTIGLQRKQRAPEDTHTMRRRLLYQMRKRGILETDLLLSTFAAQHLSHLSRDEMSDLDVLLSNIDWDIFYWATNKTQPPREVSDMPVFQKLKEHAAKRGSTIVRMPDLD
ncbi:Succinate dehydrogenase assembly factor 2 mitochondrial [Coemansia sp. RSA 1822]|nr:Succinate dehydrogenase assembly factor 2 mitochondrial [Coemansia sp. RSA 638]KAJ2125539.1 Succinate dehydrogenase assembly factor 2 mitochondrial [Coemansia sp. RSA 720]KAJ2544355.1 Succinate dehydrogenase assembly factor 2 mitochondrial [Coemansia sp. RSA 1853]KAJ2566843.1 Succinate dehydrogenase assembly factor 2 mitochondrial [Coemansia sp. RSA 1822]